MTNLKKYISILAKGMCMGAADVIPGVSGGTIAFLTGIYQELIDSIKSINSIAFKLFFSGKIKEFWSYINGTFLICVFGGILISLFSLARVMKYLLEFHPIPLWSFFFGLILASAVYILKGIDKWSFKNILCLLIGVIVAGYICLATPGHTPNDYWFIFISGAIAVCAMILPGISGSFILLLLGKYAYIMEAVTTFKISILATFAAGAIIGLLSFSHLLSWLLKRFYMETIALLSGFMLGSLIKVWPWKQDIALDATDVLAKAPVVNHPILPSKFVEVSGDSAQLGLAVLFALVGIAIVFVLEFLAKKK